MKKRILAALLSLSMVVALVSSCGDKDTTSTSTSTGTSTGTSTAAPDDSGDAVERVTEIVLPLSDGSHTFTEWRSWQDDYMSNYGEVAAIQKFEEMTGVKIEYTCAPTAAAVEKYGLMLASGDYPDMIFDGTVEGYYPGGNDTAVSDGVYRDMTEAVWQYMPNYYQIMVDYPDAKQIAITDSGKNVGIYMIRANVLADSVAVVNEPAWCGLCIRQDWLDELNMDIPVTIDDLHDVLVAFRDNYGAWMDIYKDGTIGNDYILSAYGVTGDFYMVDDSTVGYGPMTEAYKEYMTLMRDWYAEGLINPDFITTESLQIYAAHNYYANNDCGYGMTMQGICGDYHYTGGYTTEEDIYLQPVVAPVLNEGDTVNTTYQSLVACSPTFVTTSVTDEELPILAQWLDWHYTYEYAVIATWGIEGESFVIDETNDWYYVLTDKIFNPETAGMTPMSQFGQYRCFNNVGYMGWNNGLQVKEKTGSPYSKVAYDTWSAQTDSIMLPASAAMTAEEGNEYNTIFVDIETYVQEMSVQFIMGTMDIESNWDTYVSTIESMNIARCIEIKQASVARYLDKTWVLEGRE